MNPARNGDGVQMVLKLLIRTVRVVPTATMLQLTLLPVQLDITALATTLLLQSLLLYDVLLKTTVQLAPLSQLLVL